MEDGNGSDGSSETEAAAQSGPHVNDEALADLSRLRDRLQWASGSVTVAGVFFVSVVQVLFWWGLVKWVWIDGVGIPEWVSPLGSLAVGAALGLYAIETALASRISRAEGVLNWVTKARARGVLPGNPGVPYDNWRVDE